MAREYFSVPIFLICFREVLEAAIILSVLFSLVEQIVKRAQPAKLCPQSSSTPAPGSDPPDPAPAGEAPSEELSSGDAKLIRRLRIQILSGTLTGLFVSLCIGATFLAIYYTQFHDLYGNSEELWEGIFSLIACMMIFVMGVTMMQMDHSKVKWRIKLTEAFEHTDLSRGQNHASKFSVLAFLKSIFALESTKDGRSTARSSKYLLFFLPAATVLREGLEAVVFIGGVSLGQSPSSIPLAAACGIALGLIVGYAIYRSSERLNLSIFLTISTIFLMYIGAGLVTKATWYFTMHRFIKLVGGDAAEAGDGAGSFPVDGYIWHLNYGNPENKLTPGVWTIFSGVLGWNNTGTVATVMVYCCFWLLVCATLVYMKWKEGRCTIFGFGSAARERLLRRKLPSTQREEEQIEMEQTPFHEWK